MDERIKSTAGNVVAALNPRCRFANCAFLLGHMRCGSTALSSVICSRAEFSGYGESHVGYGTSGALGVLMMNLVKNGAWHARSKFLFDKVLHSRYDAAAVPDFFEARAIFLVRRPVQSIISIRKLFEAMVTGEYATDAVAASYYEERLRTLRKLWEKFPADRRLMLTHDMLVGDPDATLARVSALLGLVAPLQNTYEVGKALARAGAGDPTTAPRHTRIVKADEPAAPERPLTIPPRMLVKLEAAYAGFARLAAGASSEQSRFVIETT